MKSLMMTAVAGLMLLGIFSAAMPTADHAKKNAPVLMGDGGPAPGCYPTEPDCKPPIPPTGQQRR
jgi:hypothetical protein